MGAGADVGSLSWLALAGIFWAWRGWVSPRYQKLPCRPAWRLGTAASVRPRRPHFEARPSGWPLLQGCRRPAARRTVNGLLLSGCPPARRSPQLSDLNAEKDAAAHCLRPRTRCRRFPSLKYRVPPAWRIVRPIAASAWRAERHLAEAWPSRDSRWKRH